MILRAKYIQCRADEVGCREFKVKHADLRKPVTIIAMSRKDAEEDFAARRLELESQMPHLFKASEGEI